MAKKLLIAIVLLILGAIGLILSLKIDKGEADKKTDIGELKVIEADDTKYPREEGNISPQEPTTVDDLIKGKGGKEIMDTLDVDKMLEGYEIE